MKRFAALLVASLFVPSLASAGTLIFEEEVIKGEVQKPSISIVVTRQNLNQDYVLELQESFIPQIINAIDKKPF